MDRKTKWITGGAIAALAIAGGVGISAASGAGDDADDKPLTGSSLDRAAAAALEHTGGGTVVETEVGDDGAAYGVEIRMNDGAFVEVGLDERFNVIGQESDDDGSSEESTQNDD